MDLSPVCDSARAVGYSGPSLHWWLSLTATDQGTWFAGLGAFAAAVVALGIALSDGRRRGNERQRDGRALAAYLATEIYSVYHTLGKAIAYIERFLSHQDNALANELMAFARDINADLVGSAMEAKVDQFGKLPSDIGEELAGAVGSLEMCRAAIGKFAADLRKTKPEDWKAFCQPILDQLLQTRGNMERTKDYCRKVGGDRD
ncbi:hypothetical protein [Dyella sp.]|uniref:hypothetical protein n=1 Tax=Dyella sp. TaxID=1869338 RepID=UPI00283EC8FE|nr:hypothetical protein [Dyella sp.]MDR3445943.1 hypothetical protein [Dyella sp.]